MSHIKALLITGLATTQLITGCGGADSVPQSPKTVTATVTKTMDPLLTLTEGSTPGNGTFVACDDHSGVATDATSCKFAINVRQAYESSLRSGPVVSAFSQVTGKTYDMQCGTGFIAATKSGKKVNAVRCVGGNNAVVVIF